MSKLQEIFTKLDISEDKIKALVDQLIQNPFEAIASVQSMNIPQEILQEIMGIVMTKPEEITTFAKELGISADKVEKINDTLKGAEN